MKKLKGFKKRWYMLRDLVGFSSKKYNYKNNYTSGQIEVNQDFIFDEDKLNEQLEKLKSYKIYRDREYCTYLNKGNNENIV